MSQEIEATPVVLIVDDDEMTRLLVAETLEPEGFRVEEAASGEEGLEAFRRIRPDLVLLDVSMPGMSGLECCERMRRLPDSERVPILVLTGQDDDASISRAYEAGATDFVSKSMRWKLLGHRVRYVLRASRALEDLAHSEASLAHAQGLAHVGNWEWRPGSAPSYWSAEVYRILGLDPGRDTPSFDTFLQRVPEDERPQVSRSFINLLKQGARYSLEHRIVRPDGGERFVFQQAEALHDEQGRAILMRGALQDITERKRHEARIEYLANHDALTDLPNRNLLNDRIAQAMAQARRTGQQLALLFLDIDRFKFINDSFGHPLGDALLQAVAARLKAAVREGDTVARLGGDEFVLMPLGLAHPEEARSVAQQVLAALSRPFVVEGRELHVTASIGVSVYPEDGDGADLLLKHADTAMYRAKEQGRDGFQFYTREMGVQAQQRMALESALRRAVERQEFELHYQPKVDLRSGRISGVEALIRWRHPELGLVSPERFIPLAEETGLIVPMGEWALRTACAQAQAWHAAGYPELSMAVNVSARQFRQHDMPELVRRVLAETGLAAAQLELELTESLLLKDSESVVRTLQRLKAIGVMLSLDDFGTGYSSLSYLKRFPIDVVKIDQAFIRDLTRNVDDAALTRAIIAMAQSLNMKTIAEGVETQGQLGFLSAHRCDAIQGYYFSRPLPAEELTVLVRDGRHLPVHSVGREPAKHTLLLVDDEENVLAALNRTLRRDGYRILSALTAREALELLAIHPVGVIVSDQRMPGMSGVELFHRVKQLYPDTVRIMLSGYNELRSVMDAINEGAVYKFFTKPWEDGLLRETIAAAFRRYELIADNEQLT